jgi:hypothetical protein
MWSNNIFKKILVSSFIGRFYRVLTMVYSTQNYWDFLLFPSSGVSGGRNMKFWKLDLLKCYVTTNVLYQDLLLSN